MTLHDDLFAALCSPVLATQHGETITYTPVDGEATEITVVIRRDTEKQDPNSHGLALHRRDEIDVPTTSAAAAGGNYITSPAVRDAVTIGGVGYTVTDVLGIGPWVTLVIESFAGVERTRPNYRGMR